MDWTNLLCCSDWKTAKLFQYLIPNNADAANKVTPSSYIAEMKLTTEERLEKLKKATRKKSKLAGEVLHFSVCPDIVIFQNFKQASIYTIPLILVNKDHVSRPLQVIFDSSPYFSIKHATKTVCTKVAPGMAFEFNVNFFAGDIKDYKHKITFVTEEGTFEVPIIAIGQRPLLDLPDSIVMENTPVNIISEKVIVTQNFGEVAASYIIHTNPPFSVLPTRGALQPNDQLNLKISFEPKEEKHYKDYLIISYETGEQLHIEIEGQAKNLNITLSKELIFFKNTYMGMNRAESLILTNPSKYLITFKWKMYESNATDLKKREEMKEKFADIRDYEKLRCTNLEMTNITDRESHQMTYDRIYEDEIDEYDKSDQFLFRNRNFCIFPLCGNLWPNSTFEFKCIFSPSKRRPYESCAYLECTGISTRIPLKLSGIGIGPKVVLNLESLDAGNIFLCAIHQYEIVAINRGDIPAVVQHKHTTLDFGGQVNVLPKRLYLEPSECGSFALEFTTRQQGKFIEELLFEIVNSHEILKIFMKGDVTCPLLSFDITEIDFGLVAYGFPVRTAVRLDNKTQVPIMYSVSVKGDGLVPSVTCQEYSLYKNTPPYKPKEFSYDPSSGTVSPYTTLQGEITIIPNTIREFTSRLEVEMWGSSKHTISIPLKYISAVPSIICNPSEINIRSCFITYPYTRKIVLSNESDLPGYFTIVADESVSEENGMNFYCSMAENYIQPKEQIPITLTFSANRIGEEKLILYIIVFGNKPMKCCTITCNSQGPVISLDPKILNFGVISTLKTAEKKILLSNDSPIPANITTEITKKSEFKVIESQIDLNPNEAVPITISVYLANPEKTKDVVNIIVKNGSTITCLLEAEAVGTSILCEPILNDELHLGQIVTYHTFTFPVKFTNKSRREHKLFWSRNKIIKSFKGPTIIQSVFQFNPNSFVLLPGQSLIVNIEGFSTEAGNIDEDFYCLALIAKSNKKEIIISVRIIAEFLIPKLELSKKELHFRVDVDINTTYFFLRDSVTITNPLIIPLCIRVMIDKPFYIVMNSSEDLIDSIGIKLRKGQSYTLQIEFQPISYEKKCFVANGKLTLDHVNHTYKDIIPLEGVINYPDVKLEPDTLNFNCINSYLSAYDSIYIVNISPLPVFFKWYWLEASYDIKNNIFYPKSIPLADLDDYSSESTDSSESYEIPLIGDEKLVDLVDYTECISEFKPHEIVYQGPEIKETKTQVDINENVEEIIPGPRVLPLYTSELKNMLYHLLTPYLQIDIDEEVIKSIKDTRKRKFGRIEYFDCAPLQAALMPKECVITTIYCHPPPNTSFSIQALLDVEGGEPKILTISGMNSKCAYNLDTVIIEYEMVLFCEIAVKMFSIQNTGVATMEYTIEGCNLVKSFDPAEVPSPNSFSITPFAGLILPNQTQEFVVQYFPGVIKEFKEHFYIGIVESDTIEMTIHGYATCVQVLINTHIPLGSETNCFEDYVAIAALTKPFLKLATKLPEAKCNLDKFPKGAKRWLKKHGWVIITYNDFFATKGDIHLAIARYYSAKQLVLRPHILKKHFLKETSVIMCSINTPYYVNFGYVIKDTEVCYTLIVESYGTIKPDLSIQSTAKRQFLDAGFRMSYTRLCPMFENWYEVFLLFKPTSEKYKETDVNVHQTICIFIKHGLKVSIDISAVVTYPRITCLHQTIQFGKVRCGDCLKKSVILHNNGYILSTWAARLERARRSRQAGKPLFFLRHFTGTLEPGSEGLIDVYFEPQFGGHVTWNLIFTVTSNPDEYVVPVEGYGLSPTLRIKEQDITFKPTLPYVNNYMKTFTIENFSSVPIEFFFSDYDFEIDEEEKIIQTIVQLYGTTCVYIPPRVPGQKLPAPFLTFYRSVVDELRQKIILEEKNKSNSKHEKHNQNKCGSTSSPDYASDIENEMLQKNVQVKHSAISDSNSIAIKTSEAIETNLIERLRKCMEKEDLRELVLENVSERDPLNQTLEEAKPPPVIKDPTDLREGVIVIFYGAPQTNCHQIANKVGLKMRLPVYGIDDLFYKALVANTSTASQRVNEIITSSFLEIASDIDLINPPYTDGHDELEKKIELLLSDKPKKKPKKSSKDKAKNSSSKGSSKKGKKDKKSKGDSRTSDSKISEKTKESKSTKSNSNKLGAEKEPKKKKKDKRDTLIDIPGDLLFDILQDMLLSLKTGVVIESLNSVFIRKPVLALNFLLKGIGNIRYIHCILLSYTYQQYSTYMKRQKEKEFQLALEKETYKIEHMINMDAEEYAELSFDDMKLFRERVLYPRKEMLANRQLGIKQRILEKQRGKKDQKKQKAKKRPESKKATPKKINDTKSKKSVESSSKTGKSSKESKKTGKSNSSKSKSLETKSKSSKISDKKSKNNAKKEKNKKIEKTKLGPEEAELKNDFKDFEETFFDILHILEYWDRKKLSLTKALPMRKIQTKKAKDQKGSKKSVKSSAKISTRRKSLLSKSEESQVVPLKEITPEDELRYMTVGVPCWLIEKANCEKPVEEMVTGYLQITTEIMKAVCSLEYSLKDSLIERNELFTVLTKPKNMNRVKRNSDLFIIADGNVFSETLSHISTKLSFRTSSSARPIKSRITESKLNISSSKKIKKRSKSGNDGSYLLTKAVHSSLLSHERQLVPRRVINPGEILLYKIYFQPTACGIYSHKFTIEMTGSTKKYYLNCKGAVDIPKLNFNPEIVFGCENVVDVKTKSNKYTNCLYLKSTDTFDFGSHLAAQNSQMPLMSKFTLRNCSIMQCEVTTALRDNVTPFYTKNEPILVDLDDRKLIEVYVAPTEAKLYENQLLLSIKNNPKIEKICMQCRGTILEFYIDPHEINFERCIKFRTDHLSVFLHNNSIVGLYWVLENPSSALKYYKINPVSGAVKPHSQNEIIFEFTTLIDQVIPVCSLKLNVFQDENCLNKPVLSENIVVSAEIYSVSINCLKEVNFGDVKGRVQHTIEYEILNFGSFDCAYIIDVIEEFKEKVNKKIMSEEEYFNRIAKIEENQKVRKMFKINPAGGLLKIGKPVVLNLTFFPTALVDFKKLPVFKCIFNDHISNKLLETFNLEISGRSYFSNYIICPYDEIDFGYQLIGSTKIKEITLQNLGKFEFNYTILSLQKVIEQKQKKEQKQYSKKNKGNDTSKSSKSSVTKSSKSSKETKLKSKESSKSSKITKNKKKLDSTKKSKKSKGSKDSMVKGKMAKITRTDIGLFSLMSSTGTIQPKESTQIHITCTPMKTGPIEEIAIIFISECKPTDRNGINLPLKVIGTTPNVNFSKIEDIFAEQYITNSMKDLICLEQTDNNCIYIKEENTICFNKVCINTTASTRLRFHNKGFVPADLHGKIISGTNFSIIPEYTNIEANTHEYITINFIPDMLQVCEGSLEITYDMPVNMEKEYFTLGLYGEGHIPEISLIEPKLDTTNAFKIVYNPVLVSQSSSKLVSFKNVGIIPCKVMVQICNDIENKFAILAKDDTKHLIDGWEFQGILTNNKYPAALENVLHSKLVNLHPKEEAKFDVQYLSCSEGRHECIIKLHVLNNPFEMFEILIHAESYIENVIIDLPTIACGNLKLERDIPISLTSYELDYGYSYISRLQRKHFKISNASSDTIYRFQFPSSDKLIFTPAIGHLKPSACKEVIATFLTKEPLNLSKEILDCVICEIEYINPQLALLSWDERQNVIMWEPTDLSNQPSKGIITESSSRKSVGFSETKILRSVEGKGEPAIKIIQETVKIIPIIISIIADYCSYECDVKEVCIADTYLLEKNHFNVTIRNTSNVPLHLNWTISFDDGYPKPLGSMAYATSSLRSCHSITHLPQVDSVYERHHQYLPVELKGNEEFLPDHDENCSEEDSKPSSLFSSCDVLSRITHDTWCENDGLPFRITPDTFDIPPNDKMTFLIEFFPEDIFFYAVRLKGEITNLNPSQNGIDLVMKARSLMPHYHFDIEPSNYLAERRKGKKICEDIANENTKVLEFEAIGLGVPVIKKFNILNPASESFSYEWRPSHVNGANDALFTCQTPVGILDKNKFATVIFVFEPQEIGTYEAFYRFHIHKFNVNVLFLLVGIAREPCVFFNTPFVKLRPTIIGIDITENVVLKNNENEKFTFKILPESLFSEGRQFRIKLDPLKGVLLPTEEVSFKIYYHPMKVAEINFSVMCEVERMQQPLTLSINAQCYEVEPIISYETENGENIILDKDKVNTIEFKSLVVNQHEHLTFKIGNGGRTAFYFSWILNKEKYVGDLMKICFKDNDGYIKKHSECNSVLSIILLKNVVRKNVKIKLQISYGPSFIIELICTTLKTMYKFSFENYNFGPCIIQKEKNDYYDVCLEFTNNDVTPIMVEYDNSQLNDFTIHFKVKEVKPKSAEKIWIIFHPMEIKSYYQDVKFFANSKPHNITFRGEGVPLLVELIDMNEKYINLGSPLINKAVSKSIRVINKSRAPISITFELHDRLPYFSKPVQMLQPDFEREDEPKKKVIVKEEKKVKKKNNKKKGNKNNAMTKSMESIKSNKSNKSNEAVKKNDSKESKKGKNKKGKKELEPPLITEEVESLEMREKRLIREFISIIPKKFVRVLPQYTTEFTIKYAPTERMHQFSEKIYYQVQDYLQPLCNIKGSCVGSNYYLDKEKIIFGSVIKDCTSEYKVVLYNDGDLGGRFRWVFEKIEPTFTVTPMDGYIYPNTNITFLIRFKPTAIKCLYKTKAKCLINGLKQPLEVTLTGNCVNLPPPKETLTFTCPVREHTALQITLTNPTSQNWKLIPSITGLYFIAPEYVYVDANSTADCKIIYKPLVMSENTDVHKAHIFFALPYGQGELYNLEGIASDPLCSGTIYREIPCKTYHTEILTIKNWLKSPQQFKIINEQTNVSVTNIRYKLTGNSIIDLTAHGLREYMWTIFVLNEGTINFKVIFMNETTKEYIYFEICLTVTKCPPLEVINITTCVRIPVVHVLKLENPTASSVIYHITTSCQYLYFETPVTVPPLTQHELKIEFNPLTPGKGIFSFEATALELGTYFYEFNLTANSAIPESLVKFETNFGSSIVQKINLHNYTKQEATFSTKIDGPPVFSTDKSLTVLPESTGFLNINFEPNSMGNVDATLMLTSSTAGEYIYPLAGISNYPKPRGPYTIKLGTYTYIPFSNPFNEIKLFNFKTHPNLFVLKINSETIKPKKELKIGVNAVITKDFEMAKKYSQVGKLFVNCVDHPDVVWLYYLKTDGQSH